MIERYVSARLGRRVRAAVAFIALLACLVVSAHGQTTDLKDNPPPPRSVRSSRPVLVKVEFEGNNDNDLNDKVLAAQIKSKGTGRPTLRAFSIFARVYDVNPLMPQYMRDEMHRIVDSLSEGERYLNPRLLPEDTMELRRIYEQFGYPEAQIDYRIIIDTASNRSIIRFFIDEGPRYKNHGITYVGLEEVPEDVRESFREPRVFDIGDDYRSEEVINETSRAVAELQNRGYPFASRTALVTIQRNDSANNLRYDSTLASIYTGNRYRFGETVYLPDSNHAGPPLKPWVVMRQLEYAKGEWYSRQKVDQTLSNLYGLGVFEYVHLDSLRAKTVDDTLGMQLVVSLQDPRTILITPELSLERYINDYYAFLGVRSSYSHANFFGGAEKVTLEGWVRMPYSALTTAFSDLNLLTYGGSLTYLDPTLLGLRRSLQFSIGYDRSIEDRVIEEVAISPTESDEFNFPLFSDRFFGSAEFSQRLPKYTWLSSYTVRGTMQYLKYGGVRDYILKKAELRVREADVAKEQTDEAVAQVYDAMVGSIFREQVWLGDNASIVPNEFVREEFSKLKWSAITSVSTTGDKRDDYFSARNGYYTEGRFEFGSTLAWTPWVKAEAEYRKYWPWDDDKTVAVRGHAGVIVPFGAIKLVPLTSRFWAGGANSMRGWGPREMLVTRPPTELDSGVGREVVAEVLRDGRRLLGGLVVAEVMGDWRWRPFRFPATSPLIQQVNQLMMVAGVDVGGAFFRDFQEDGATWGKVIRNIGVSPSLALGYDTPIGPLRFGAGWALRDPVNYPDAPWIWERAVKFGDLAWFFSIGHAF
jgi:outer membrane protein assembly factor BamA